MKYDWINISLENRGIVTVSLLPQGIVASMNWPGTDPVSGEPQTTLPDALTALNAALEDDAAEEVCPSNASAMAPPPQRLPSTKDVPGG
jgi:hypothetical protein